MAAMDYSCRPSQDHHYYSYHYYHPTSQIIIIILILHRKLFSLNNTISYIPNMPSTKAGSRKHHCPMEGKGRCRSKKANAGGYYCGEHQIECRVGHPQAHLKTEPCPTCETTKFFAQKRMEVQVKGQVKHKRANSMVPFKGLKPIRE